MRAPWVWMGHRTRPAEALTLLASLSLAPPAAAVDVRGAVRTWPDGVPVAGITVRVVDRTGAAWSAQSDDTGEYVIAAPEDLVRVQAAPGPAFNLLPAWYDDRPFFCFAESIDLRDGAPASLDFALPSGGTIGGSVVDSAGRGLGGASVLAEGVDFGNQNLRRTATTDAEGFFEIRGLDAWSDESGPAPGHYRLSVRSAGGPPWYAGSGWDPVGATAVAVVRGEHTTLDLVEPKGHRVEGRVIDEMGLAIVGARIEASVGGSSPVVVFSDDAGHWELLDLPGMALTLRISAAGARTTHWPSQTAWVGAAEPLGADKDVGDITLPPGARIDVAVPVEPGARITFSDEAGHILATLSSGSTMSLDGLPRGPLRYALSPGPQSSWLRPGPSGTVDTSSGEATLVLDPPIGASMRVRVLARGGRALRGAQVRVFVGADVVHNGSTDDDGELMLHGLPDGVTVEATWPVFCPNDPGFVATWSGDVPTQERALVVDPGEDLVLTLPPDGDRDGLDDLWEWANGADPTVADGGAEAPGGGTWLQRYQGGAPGPDEGGCGGGAAALPWWVLLVAVGRRRGRLHRRRGEMAHAVGVSAAMRKIRRLAPTLALVLLGALVPQMIGCVASAPAEATPDPLPTCTGDRLFGAPNNNTGLGADQCGATCTCGGSSWSPPTYADDDFAAWRSLPLLDPFPTLDTDPYADALPPAPEGADPVCVVVLDEGGYRLETRSAPDGAGFVTHTGACGRCSTLADLATYAAIPDLTEPVRTCGLDHLFDPDANVLCLEALGFTHPCAQIWMWNTRATRASCGDLCFAALDDPYHHPDGTLNDCLACDEQESGPTFLAIAGRTRRNTGLASSMCRPCEEVRPIVQPRAADLR